MFDVCIEEDTWCVRGHSRVVPAESNRRGSYYHLSRLLQ